MEQKQEQKRQKHKNLDLILLLSILAVAIIVPVAYGQSMINQAVGEDAEIFIDYGGFAFQDGTNPSSFIALYTPEGALNSSDNEFYIGPVGGGRFEFLSNESFTLQLLLSVSANIQGDSGNGERGVTHDSDGLSENYTVLAGNRVVLTWAPSVDFVLWLPMVSFWGMVGGGLLGSVFLGAAFRKRNFKLLMVGLVCVGAAIVFYLVFMGGG